MADKNDDRRAGPPLPPTPEFAGDRYIAPEDMRAGYPPRCRPIDEGTKKTLEFIEAMTPEVAYKYRGEWIAVASGEIVAHGKNPRLVCQEGRKAGKGAIFVDYIYAGPEEVPLLGSGYLSLT